MLLWKKFPSSCHHVVIIPMFQFLVMWYFLLSEILMSQTRTRARHPWSKWAALSRLPCPNHSDLLIQHWFQMNFDLIYVRPHCEIFVKLFNMTGEYLCSRKVNFDSDNLAGCFIQNPLMSVQIFLLTSTVFGWCSRALIGHLRACLLWAVQHTGTGHCICSFQTPFLVTHFKKLYSITILE